MLDIRVGVHLTKNNECSREFGMGIAEGVANRVALSARRSARVV
jgi:hypothetical protein